MADDGNLRNFDPMNADVLAAALEDENKDLLDRVAALLPTAAEWEKAPDIDNDEDAADLADFLKQLNLISGDKGQANVRREARKGPYDVCAKVVQTFFKSKIIDDLEAKRKALTAKANKYLADKRAAAEKEAARLREEARKKAEAATTPEQIKEASALLKTADKVGSSSGVKSDFGASLHSTSRWDFEVVDIKLVPTKFLLVDRSAVMGYIRTGSVDNPVKIEGILIKRVSSAVGT